MACQPHECGKDRGQTAEDREQRQDIIHVAETTFTLAAGAHVA